MYNIISKDFSYKFFKSKSFLYFKRLKWLVNKTNKDENFFYKSRSLFLKNKLRSKMKYRNSYIVNWFDLPFKVNSKRIKRRLAYRLKRTPSKHRAFCYITILNTNIFININSAFKGQSLCRFSAGMLGFKGRNCRSIQAVRKLINFLILKLSLFGFKGVYLFYRGFMYSKLLKTFILKLKNLGFRIYSIFLNNLLAHNGSRPCKLKRK